jgi:release factor glutamine methyltransferase
LDFESAYSLKLSLLPVAPDAYSLPVSVLEVIQRSTEFLKNKSVDSPRLQTELLLAHMLSMPRMQLYLNFERKLSQTELDSFRELIKRRGQREPLQHIVGSTSFCGLELTVNRHVLIPRQETELLAEKGWTFLTSSPSTINHQLSAALDLGTGSGCLAIALAVHCPAAQLIATDVSAEALELATKNAARHNVLDRINFLQGDAFAAIESAKTFDLIISNPPYIPTGEIQTLQIEVRDHDPRQALDGGPDGLAFYRRIAAEAAPFLKPDGKIMLEFGDGQAPSVCEIFESQKWIVEAIVEDYTQRPRILIAHG